MKTSKNLNIELTDEDEFEVYEDIYHKQFLNLGGKLDKESFHYYRKCMEAILDRFIGGYTPVCDRDFTWKCFVKVCASNSYPEDSKYTSNRKANDLAELIFKSIDSIDCFS